MKVKCMTCQHVMEGQERRTVGCLCDPDAPTWLAVVNNKDIVGGTYKYFIPLAESE